MYKISLISCYIGKWPPWLPIFLESCRCNSTIEFYFFTDCAIPNVDYPNIHFISLSLNEFNQLASQKLLLPINIKRPLKVMDYRPAYGAIFQDYIKDTDYWGGIDIDLIFGDIRKILTDDLLSKYDVICTKKEFVSGHFTLYKNTEENNYLFTKSKDYKEVFTSNINSAFDECGFIHTPLLRGSSIHEIKSKIDSIMHVMLRTPNLRICFQDLCEEQLDLNEFLLAKKKWEMEWNNGVLVNKIDNKEVLYFHFQFFKRFPNFYFPKWKKIPPNFTINRNGFHSVYDNKGFSFITSRLKRISYFLSFIFIKKRQFLLLYFLYLIGRLK